MNKKIIVVLLIIIAIISFLVTIFSLKQKNIVNNLPDDDSVSVSSYSQQRDEAINKYLLAQSDFAWQTADPSTNFCVFETLEANKETFPLSIWINCGEFGWVDGQANRLSGVSMPILVEYPNELSFFDVNQFTHQAPRDGSDYQADVNKIFPLEIQDQILNFKDQNLSEKLQQLAQQNLQVNNSKREVSVRGSVICLTHKDKTGPQTMECAYGFRDESGQDFALSDPEMKFIPTLEMNKTVLIRGILMDQPDSKYDSQGLIEILSVE